MYKILIAGCGNIGALYDWDTDTILTHAKAFSKHKDFEVTFFDTDAALLQKVSERYNAAAINDIDAITDFDCISICTPTSTHYNFLQKAFAAKTKLVICEKPVSYNLSELNMLNENYVKGVSKVMVNYMRRFLPAYKQLKVFVQQLLLSEQLTNISIRYQRGFINNCSHALDVLQYITDKPVQLTGFIKSNEVNDHFENDPTISALAEWNGVNISIMGLTNVLFAHFETDLYFQYHKITIKESGNIIEVFKAEKESRFLKPLQLQPQLCSYNCMDNYMLPVAAYAYNLLQEQETQDNFAEAVQLNQSILNCLNN